MFSDKCSFLLITAALLSAAYPCSSQQSTTPQKPEKRVAGKTKGPAVASGAPPLATELKPTPATGPSLEEAVNFLDHAMTATTPWVVQRGTQAYFWPGEEIDSITLTSRVPVNIVYLHPLRWRDAGPGTAEVLCFQRMRLMIDFSTIDPASVKYDPAEDDLPEVDRYRFHFAATDFQNSIKLYDDYRPLVGPSCEDLKSLSSSDISSSQLVFPSKDARDRSMKAFLRIVELSGGKRSSF